MSYMRICSLAATVAFLACQGISAQQAQGHLQVVVDGSVTPDLIPDSLAYRHFFTANRRTPVSGYTGASPPGRTTFSNWPFGGGPASLDRRPDLVPDATR